MKQFLIRSSDRIRFNKPGLSQGQSQGQSLVELVLVMIVLLPILMGVGYIGMIMYQGAIASEAIKEPATSKSVLASKSGTVSTSEILGLTQNGGRGSALPGSAPLDSVRVSAPVGDTVLLIGEKKSITMPLINLNMNFTVVQPVQASLLEANTGTRTSTPSTPPTDLAGAPGPPWENPAFSDMPARIECAPSGATVTQTTADGIYANAPGHTYDSRVTFSVPVQLGLSTVLQFAQSADVTASCQNVGTECAAEQTDLMPKDATTFTPGCAGKCMTAKYYENPKGAPGKQLELYVEDGKPPVSTYTEKYPAPHGLYYAQDYTQPPSDFVTSCQQRKKAECAVQKAAQKANDLFNAIKDNCTD